jgi:hypothetical protein
MHEPQIVPGNGQRPRDIGQQRQPTTREVRRTLPPMRLAITITTVVRITR